MKTADLDRRTNDVLRSVVEEYIQSGDPVGSRTLSKSPHFALSAATIRNIMADLEEMGFLGKPHASAGRMPTEKGYRWYVDHLGRHAKLPGRDEDLVAESLDRVKGDLDSVIDMATQLLARLSRYAGVIVTPRIDTAVLAHVDFIRLERGRILVILATTAGAVQHKVIDVEEDYNPDELSGFARFVADHYNGLTLRDVRARVLEAMQAEKQEYDRLVRGAIDLAGRTFAATEERPEIHIEGALNILETPEFADLGRLKALVKTFQEREKLLRILDEVIGGRGLHVIIGSESQIAELSGLSLVSATYRAGDAAGALGVIGPTRMDYDRAVAVVDRMAELLSQRLTHGTPGEPRTGGGGV